MGKNFPTGISLLLLISLAIFVVVTLERTSIFTKAAGKPDQLPPPGTEVIPVFSRDTASKDNLQLKTFPYSTLTPRPGQQDNTGSTSGVSGECGSVLSMNLSKISPNLRIGSEGLYNAFSANQSTSCYKTTTAGSHYWCTYSIADSYNLAGLKGLTPGAHAAVVNMHRWWKTAPGYKYVEYGKTSDKKGALTQVKPGFAMMMETSYLVHTGSEHVNMVKSISIDGNGNGALTTVDSNSNTKEHKFPIAGWQVKNVPYPVAAFGGH